MSVDRESASKPRLDRVLREEADFADQDYRAYIDDLEINPGMFRRYHSPGELWDWRQRSALLLGDLAGSELLDFGCGMGEESIYFSRLGARVTAIDISEVGIATLRRRAARHRLDIRALEMRADPTSFADASFDRIHGLGILHHIGIERGLQEVARLLRPGGTGVFLEPMGDSPAVETVKRWLMKYRALPCRLRSRDRSRAHPDLARGRARASTVPELGTLSVSPAVSRQAIPARTSARGRAPLRHQAPDARTGPSSLCWSGRNCGPRRRRTRRSQRRLARGDAGAP